MDSRFDTSRDPRFKAVPQRVRKVKVDERFSSMFEDKRFRETAKVDARGQKIKRGANKERLKSFYALDEKSAPEKEDATKEKSARKPGKKRQPAELTEEPEGEEVEEEDDAGSVDEDSEEEDETDSEEAEEADEEDANPVWDMAQENVPHGDATQRLAVMGCDWDRVSAGDVMVMFTTYLNSTAAHGKGGLKRPGSVTKVSVYPSDFGLKAMAEEAKSGPDVTAAKAEAAKRSSKKKKKSSQMNLHPHLDDADDEDDDDMEALRQYQMKRSKYYWALVEFDSVTTASWCYDQMDGIEADGVSVSILDLRFVPDDLEPPHAPREETSEMPRKYQAPEIVSSAVGHSKVKCTWDEAPDRRRKDLMKKKFTRQEVMDANLTNYLASSSGEEDEEGAEALKKLARGEGEGDDSDFFASDADDDDKKEELGDMEATFNLRSDEIEKDLTARLEKSGGGKRSKALAPDEEKTVWQKYLDRKKDKKRERKQKAKADRLAAKKGDDNDADGDVVESRIPSAADAADKDHDEIQEADLGVLAAGEDDEDERGFNARGSRRLAHSGKKLGKKKAAAVAAEAEDEFKVDTEDPRIAAVFSNADFEIDPTNPEFRKTDGMSTVLKKKRSKKLAAIKLAAEGVQSAAPNTQATDDKSASAGASRSGSGLGGLKLFAGKSSRGDGLEGGSAATTRASKIEASAGAITHDREISRKRMADAVDQPSVAVAPTAERDGDSSVQPRKSLKKRKLRANA